MYQLGPKPPRAPKTQGVAGLLGQEARIYFESLYSTTHVGRVSDLLAARLRDVVGNELTFRTVLLQGIFESYRNLAESFPTEDGKLSDPAVIEVGVDESLVAVGFSYIAKDSESVPKQAAFEKSEATWATVIAQLATYVPVLVVKTQSTDRRIELIALYEVASLTDALGSGAAQAGKVEWIDLDEAMGPAPQVTQRIELGDLNYPELLRDDAPGKLSGQPGLGNLLARQSSPKTHEDTTRVEGADADAESKTLVDGDVADADNTETTIGGEERPVGDAATKVVGTKKESNDPLARILGLDAAIGAHGAVQGDTTPPAETPSAEAATPAANEEEPAQDISGELEAMEQAALDPTSGVLKTDVEIKKVEHAMKMESRSGNRDAHYESKIAELQRKLAELQNVRATEQIIVQAMAPPPVAPAAPDEKSPEKKSLDSSSGSAPPAEAAAASVSGPASASGPAPVKTAGTAEGTPKDSEESAPPTDEVAAAPAAVSALRALISRIFPWGRKAEPALPAPEGATDETTEEDEEDTTEDGGDLPAFSLKSGVEVGTAEKLEDVAKKIIAEVEGGQYEQTINRAQEEAAEVKKRIKDEKVKDWVDGMMTELVAEKSRLHELAKKLNVSIRQKELEFRNRESSHQEESRRKDESLRQKDFALVRAREQILQMATTIEKAKDAKATGTDEGAFRQKFEQSSRLVGALKDENKAMVKRMDDLKNQLMKAQQIANIAKGGPSGKDFQEMQNRYEHAQRQLDEMRRANAKLAETAKGAGKSKNSKFNMTPEEMKGRLDTAMRMLAAGKKENERVATKLSEMQQESVKLKADVARLQGELRKKPGSSGGKAA